jgi:hypothetical protein
MLPCERKSVEPMAAVTAPSRTAAQHQSLLHFVGQGGWSDVKVLAKVRELVLPAIERQGPIEAWIIDDTGFPKQGRHSVGVARQYCGQLGKQDNCQVAVSLSIANRHASLPVAYRLYLPQDWAGDGVRRRKAGVPADIEFRTKPEIALEQLRWACAAGLPRGVALLDAGYGNNSELRADITALDLTYVAGILSTTTVWAPGTRPLVPRKNGLAVGDRRRACAAMPSISRSRSRSLHCVCPSAPGARCNGAKVRPSWDSCRAELNAVAPRAFVFRPFGAPVGKGRRRRVSSYCRLPVRTACGTPGHPREIRSTVGPIEGAIDTLNEGPSVKRLREKADGPARKCPLLDSRIRKGGNKDDWRSTIFGRQSVLQL